MNIILQLIRGAVGGNVAGGLLKKFSLGTIGNSIVGILDGGRARSSACSVSAPRRAVPWTSAS